MVGTLKGYLNNAAPRRTHLRAHLSASFSSCSSALLCQGGKCQAGLCDEFQTKKEFCLILCLLSFLLGYFIPDGKDVPLSWPEIFLLCHLSRHSLQSSQHQLASGYPRIWVVVSLGPWQGLRKGKPFLQPSLVFLQLFNTDGEQAVQWGDRKAPIVNRWGWEVFGLSNLSLTLCPLSQRGCSF